MTWPNGYRVIVIARRASLTELERIAQSARDPLIRANAALVAAHWKETGGPIITVDQPDGHYTGWVLSPSDDVEWFDNGVRQFTKVNYYEKRHALAYGLGGENALDERRH